MGFRFTQRLSSLLSSLSYVSASTARTGSVISQASIEDQRIKYSVRSTIFGKKVIVGQVARGKKILSKGLPQEMEKDPYPFGWTRLHLYIQHLHGSDLHSLALINEP